MQALAERRRRAVKLREKGMRVNEVARTCEQSRGTVIAAHEAYCLDGGAGVALKPRGRSTGVGRRLNAEQEREVQKLIRDKTPDQIQTPCALPPVESHGGDGFDRSTVQKLPVRTVGTYLARWGFTPQKPIQKAYEQRPVEVRNGLIASKKFSMVARVTSSNLRACEKIKKTSHTCHLNIAATHYREALIQQRATDAKPKFPEPISRITRNRSIAKQTPQSPSP